MVEVIYTENFLIDLQLNGFKYSLIEKKNNNPIKAIQSSKEEKKKRNCF